MEPFALKQDMLLGTASPATQCEGGEEVIGRKNWLFSDTDKGADASARCYSIIESANLNDLNVFGYLSYLLTELPKLGEDPSDEQLDCLMPWSETLPGYCKNV